MSISLIPYIFLSLSLMMLIFDHKKTAFVFLFVSLYIFYINKDIDIQSMLVVFTGLLVSERYSHAKSKVERTIIIIFISIISLLLSFHFFSGFNNVAVIKDIIVKKESIPYSLHLNIDKPMISYFWFLICKDSTKSKLNINLKFSIFIPLLLFIIFYSAIYLNLIKFDFLIPNWYWWFVLSNLFLTSIPEEFFFRGALQNSLGEYWGVWVALLISSVFFGIVHIAFGFAFVVLAAVAGFLYGLIFLITKRLWCSILFHFLFNFSWLIFFTFPMLK